MMMAAIHAVCASVESTADYHHQVHTLMISTITVDINPAMSTAHIGEVLYPAVVVILDPA